MARAPTAARPTVANLTTFRGLSPGQAGFDGTLRSLAQPDSRGGITVRTGPGGTLRGSGPQACANARVSGKRLEARANSANSVTAGPDAMLEAWEADAARPGE